MVVNPVNGKVYVSNTEARNDLRFEGPGAFAGSTPPRPPAREPHHRAELHGGVAPRHLNKHIDYARLLRRAVPNTESEKSLAQPLGMAVTSDGATLYVAAFGSSKIGVYTTAALETDTFVPSTAEPDRAERRRADGLVLDEARGRLYVLTRFDNAISVVDTGHRQEIGPPADAQPRAARASWTGRRFLYDARFSSSHGDSSCASCHIFGDFDSLAWDLGNPDGDVHDQPEPHRPGVPEFGTIHVRSGLRTSTR